MFTFGGYVCGHFVKFIMWLKAIISVIEQFLAGRIDVKTLILLAFFMFLGW